MGQRLVLRIKNSEKDLEELMNIYYHWSGYTCSAFAECNNVADLIKEYIRINGHYKDVPQTKEDIFNYIFKLELFIHDHSKIKICKEDLSLIYLLDKAKDPRNIINGYGQDKLVTLSAGNEPYFKNVQIDIFKNVESEASLAGMDPDDFIINKQLDRNEGILSISRKEMKRSMDIAEMCVDFFLLEEIFDMSGAFYSVDEESNDYDEDEKESLSKVKASDDDLSMDDFSNIKLNEMKDVFDNNISSNPMEYYKDRNGTIYQYIV